MLTDESSFAFLVAAVALFVHNSGRTSPQANGHREQYAAFAPAGLYEFPIVAKMQLHICIHRLRLPKLLSIPACYP